MSSQGVEGPKERELVQRCLAGDSEALAQLHKDYLLSVMNLLVARGVEAAWAREVVEGLWGDCVVESRGQPAILERFNAKSSLRTWLFRIALNRVLDRARRLKYSAVPTSLENTDGLVLNDNSEPGLPEPDLLLLLRESLRSGIAACPAEGLLKLKLAFMHGVSQRELARLWNCHESTISRDLQSSMQLIAEHTLSEVRRRDPRLRLTWEDFVALCDADACDFL